MANPKESTIVVPWIAIRRHHIFFSTSIRPLRSNTDTTADEFEERPGPHSVGEAVSVSNREPPLCFR
jgi:hypothetical protein